MLQPLPDYRPPAGIRARAYSVHWDQIPLDWAISVVAFDGTIPDGSEGRDHAEFVKLACLDAMARQDAKCIVMDFRECAYRWGNSIETAFDAFRRLYFYEWYDIEMSTPVKIVVSEKSAGFRSLLPEQIIFEDIEAAITACGRDLEKWDVD